MPSLDLDSPRSPRPPAALTRRCFAPVGPFLSVLSVPLNYWLTADWLTPFPFPFCQSGDGEPIHCVWFNSVDVDDNCVSLHCVAGPIPSTVTPGVAFPSQLQLDCSATASRPRPSWYLFSCSPGIAPRIWRRRPSIPSRPRRSRMSRTTPAIAEHSRPSMRGVESFDNRKKGKSAVL